MGHVDLGKCAILVVEAEPLLALDVQQAGAVVCVVGNAAAPTKVTEESRFAAAVVDWRPASDEHRIVARALKGEQVPFLFYATDAPEEVTTVRGAPVVLKPARREEIVGVVALLTGSCSRRTNERCAGQRIFGKLVDHMASWTSSLSNEGSRGT